MFERNQSPSNEARIADRAAGPRATGETPRRGVLRALLDLLSSVWLGIALAAMLFVYCSIGSALPAVRSMPGLEMTEFEWFSLVAVPGADGAVLRQPLRRHGPADSPSLGERRRLDDHTRASSSWSSAATTTSARRSRAMPPCFDAVSASSIPARKSHCRSSRCPARGPTFARTTAFARFEVQSTNSAWPLLSGEDKGETAYSVNLAVTPPRRRAIHIGSCWRGTPSTRKTCFPVAGGPSKRSGGSSSMMTWRCHSHTSRQSTST